MNRKTAPHFNIAAVWLTLLFLLAGCSPPFDWREVHGMGPAPYTVLLPAKPASMTRQVNLGGIKADMIMTAAETGGLTFAVGSAELTDTAQAAAALAVMKTAMVQNISGTIRREKTAATPAATRIEIEATGQARLMQAHFIVRGRHVYQLVLLGPEGKIPAEVAETFFDSFKPG